MKTPSYEAVEALLFRGFLAARCEVAGVPVVLKTLTQTEFDLVTLQGDTLSGDWRLYSAYYLAYSTLFFNRQPMLRLREEWLPELAECYRELPDAALVTLLLSANRLNEKAREVLTRVQAYTYGAASRERWGALKHLALCDPTVTGIAGTERVGLNYHQRLWSFLNRLEDEQEAYLRDYGLAKFIVSPHAPKEIQKMDRRDNRKEKALKKHRRKLYLGRPSELNEEREVRVGAETAEELLEQMERTIRGEKDYHDLVIEAHQKRVRAAYLKREAERRKVAQVAAARRRQMAATEAPVRGLTPEEVEHLSRKQREEAGKARESQDWYDPVASAEQEKNLVRWGFISPEDIPESRRDWYDPRSYRPDVPDEDDQNPLMRDHYQRVKPDRGD